MDAASPPPDCPDYARWEHGERQRYYEFRRLPDLWGACATLTCWGTIGTSLGRQVHNALASTDAAAMVFEGIARRRTADGYRLVVSA
ncbi:hypothetical protein ASF43_14200 [Pseudorhodoferax sp. Leaf267]|nr:hypothetical protein ASF43_14200 [Pseudorhodoferax sp. Leaf267]